MIEVVKSKILFIVPTDEMGGAEQLIKLLAINYQMNNNNVHVICLTKQSDKNGWADYQGNINYFKTSNVFIGFFYLLFYIFNSKYDIVFSSQVYINGFLGFLRNFKWYKFSKLIVRESTSVFLRFTGFKLWTYKTFYKLGYKNADLIICQTELMKQQLIENFSNLKAHNVQVIQNPIDLKNIEAKAKLDFEYGNIDNNLVVALGRMIPAKGFDVLIQSFNTISQLFPDLKLLILGDGPEKNKLKNLVNEFGLDSKVFMPGYSQNPFPYLKKAKVCVVSSRIEGFPNILLQMMALNNNVVCTKCAGGIENIKGIHIAETNDDGSLSNAMIDSLKNNNSDQNRLIFDLYLSEKSIDNFISTMENN